MRGATTEDMATPEPSEKESRSKNVLCQDGKMKTTVSLHSKIHINIGGSVEVLTIEEARELRDSLAGILICHDHTDENPTDRIMGPGPRPPYIATSWGDT